ncbi:MAG: GNAT family N-acetyltransferase [Pseudomonadota bacterium]|nr:GNAT family N-acetyltransferase [Pseudomonadota bacterium]MEC8467849.1 GNAT family N-acetyltransferase [Pseudomonadota bacterium]
MAIFNGFTHESVANNLNALRNASVTSHTLKQVDIPNIVDLQDTVIEGLPSHKKHFIAKRSKEDFLRFMHQGGQIIGLKDGEDLVAYSIVHFPQTNEETGFDPKIATPELNTCALLKSTVVHPDFRGRGLQKTLIDARLEQAALAGKETAICEVDIQNAASIKSLMSKGFTIRDAGVSPVDGMPSVYMYKSLTQVQAHGTSNALQLVAVEDWAKHCHLLKNGHVGVDYFDGFITYQAGV